LACLCGFVFQALREFFYDSWSTWQRLVFLAVFGATAITCSLMAIFLIGALVVGDQPGRPDFWPRALIYGSGIAAGITFMFTSGHLINVGIRQRAGYRA
jgi:hypothetical protein